MDTNELILTHLVTQKARELRKHFHHDVDEDINEPPLEPYIKEVIKGLKTWHSVVMDALDNPK